MFQGIIWDQTSSSSSDKDESDVKSDDDESEEEVKNYNANLFSSEFEQPAN